MSRTTVLDRKFACNALRRWKINHNGEGFRIKLNDIMNVIGGCNAQRSWKIISQQSGVEMKLNIDITDVKDNCEMEHRGRLVMVVMLTLFLNRYGVIAIPQIRCRLDLANAWKVGCIQPHISTMATVDDLVTKGVRLSVIGSFPRSII